MFFICWFIFVHDGKLAAYTAATVAFFTCETVIWSCQQEIFYLQSTAKASIICICSMDLKHKWKSHSIVSTAIIDSVAVQYTHTAPTQCRYIRIPIDRMSSWAHISTFGYHQHQRKHTWYKESTNRKHPSSTNGVRKWDIDFIRCFFIISMLEKWIHSGNKNATKTHIKSTSMLLISPSWRNRNISFLAIKPTKKS